MDSYITGFYIDLYQNSYTIAIQLGRLLLIYRYLQDKNSSSKAPPVAGASGSWARATSPWDPTRRIPWDFIHGKSMENPQEIHGKSMEIQGKSMENQWNIHRGKSTDSTMNNLFFNNQTEDSLGKCGYLATSTWISNDLTLVTQPKPLKNDSKWGI